MSIFTIIYFILVAAAVITGIVYFCISHPETAKLIGMCTTVVIITLAMIFFSMPARAEEVEDFDIGDVVALILWDAGTPESIFDDEIIDATYAGTLNQLGAWIK